MKRLIIASVLGLLLTGCTYYKITDPGSGKEYYTNDLNAARYTMNGAVIFTDMETGKTVTLQNSEVQRVDREAAVLHTGKQ